MCFNCVLFSAMTGLCGFVSSLCTASAHHISSVSTASNIRYTPSFHTQDPKVVSLNHDSYGFTYDKVVGTYCSWSVTYSVGSIVFKYLPLVALYSDFTCETVPKCSINAHCRILDDALGYAVH